jgi:uncharacterized short protein YbdD (DUF466 family)
MTGKEFCSKCREKREEAKIALTKVCQQAKLNYWKTRRMEEMGVCKLGMNNIISYLSATHTILLLQSPSGDITINEYKDIANWLSNFIKDYSTQEQLTEKIRDIRDTLDYINKDIIDMDSFLEIVELLGYHIQFEKKQTENMPGEIGMLRVEFCRECQRLREKAGVSYKKIWKQIGFGHTKIKYIDSAKHNVNMKDILIYLSAFQFKISLVSPQDTQIINSYDDIIDWVIRKRTGKYTQKQLAKQIDRSYNIIVNAEKKQNIMRIDTFLRIVGLFGYEIKFEKTGDESTQQ